MSNNQKSFVEAFDDLWNHFVDPAEAAADEDGTAWLRLAAGGLSGQAAEAPFSTETELAALRTECRALAATNEFAINGHDDHVTKTTIGIHPARRVRARYVRTGCGGRGEAFRRLGCSVGRGGGIARDEHTRGTESLDDGSGTRARSCWTSFRLVAWKSHGKIKRRVWVAPTSGPGRRSSFSIRSAVPPGRPGLVWRPLVMELWKSTLLDLKGRFLALEEKYPGLRCLMRQVKKDTDLHAVWYNRPAMSNFWCVAEKAPWCSFSHGDLTWQVVFVYKLPSADFHGLTKKGMDKLLLPAFREFQTMANHAGTALRGATDHLKKQYSSLLSPYFRADDSGWLRLMFLLAWDRPKGSVLQAWKNLENGDLAGHEAKEFISTLAPSPWLASMAVIDTLVSGERDLEQTTIARKGVSLRDAATLIRTGDEQGQKELIRQWQNSKKPELPKPIGKAPKHSQRNLYEPTSLLTFLKKVEGESVNQDFKLSSQFSILSREPIKQ